jgi:hypothetical protein
VESQPDPLTLAETIKHLGRISGWVAAATVV